jgi:DnaK suppressor protein
MLQVDTQAVRQTLLTEQQRLLQELDALIRRDQLLPTVETFAPEDVPGDWADQAEEHRSDELQHAMMAQLHERLTQVKEALQRLDEGTYGRCVRCGRPIDQRRLAAIPTALYDVTCQALQEAQEP